MASTSEALLYDISLLIRTDLRLKKRISALYPLSLIQRENPGCPNSVLIYSNFYGIVVRGHRLVAILRDDSVMTCPYGGMCFITAL